MKDKAIFVSLVFVAALTAATILAQVRSADRSAAQSQNLVRLGPAAASDETEFDGKSIVKTKAEWRKLLSKKQFYILREEGTEAPYTSALNNNHEPGTYHCAACGLALFKSENKFDSGTGWPSFYQPIFEKNIVEVKDTKLTEERTEVECARCRSHLGHVFDDGPKPTSLRYCINGIALKFRSSSSAL